MTITIIRTTVCRAHPNASAANSTPPLDSLDQSKSTGPASKGSRDTELKSSIADDGIEPVQVPPQGELADSSAHVQAAGKVGPDGIAVERTPTELPQHQLTKEQIRANLDRYRSDKAMWERVLDEYIKRSPGVAISVIAKELHVRKEIVSRRKKHLAELAASAAGTAGGAILSSGTQAVSTPGSGAAWLAVQRYKRKLDLENAAQDAATDETAVPLPEGQGSPEV